MLFTILTCFPLLRPAKLRSGLNAFSGTCIQCFLALSRKYFGLLTLNRIVMPQIPSSDPRPVLHQPSLTAPSPTPRKLAIDTPLPSPVSLRTYASPYSGLSTIFPSNTTYTTYSLNYRVTEERAYGEVAYYGLWRLITYNNTPISFTTTVSPTPVATSELVLPPALYQPCLILYSCVKRSYLPEDFVWGVIGSSAWQLEATLQREGRGPSQSDSIDGLGSPRPWCLTQL